MGNQLARDIDNDRPSAVASTDAVVEKIRSELASAELQCQCRKKVDDIIIRLVDRECHEERATALREARAMRDRICGYVGLLVELNDLTPDEQDTSCFREIAMIFEDIGFTAGFGARAALRAAGSEPERQDR